MNVSCRIGFDFRRWALPLCIRFGADPGDSWAYFAVEVLCFYVCIEWWRI